MPLCQSPLPEGHCFPVNLTLKAALVYSDLNQSTASYGAITTAKNWELNGISPPLHLYFCALYPFVNCRREQFKASE